MRGKSRRFATALAALACAIGLVATPAATAQPAEPIALQLVQSLDVLADRDTKIRLPAVNSPWDYQIGGAFRPAPPVRIVVRDRLARTSSGDYNICYVNAFQTQPDEVRFWHSDSPRAGLVLERKGRRVVDGAWGEFLLDTRTAGKRDRIARIVGRWMAGCARDGFDAVELDNLDSWSRSQSLVTRKDNVAMARLLIARAHRQGLAVAQKNWAELAPRGRRIGFDFAVAEECGRWNECRSYARGYADRVLVVEYRRADFRAVCSRWRSRLSVVLRDLEVSRRGVNRRC